MSFSSVRSLSHVRLFVTSWTAARQPPLSITNSWSLLKLISINQWCHPTISSSVIHFFSWLQSFPASESFQMSQFFASGGQIIGASASVHLMNIQDWSHLGLTWDPWCPKDSQASPTPQFKSSNSLAISFPYVPSLTNPYMTTGKNRSFDCMDLC